MINFPFGTNGKFIFLGVPILKHITVTEFANSIDPEEATHNKLPYLDVFCLPLVFEFFIYVAWKKHFFCNFADINFVVHFFYLKRIKQPEAAKLS